jgi:mono/diheme cytochrome c family protein
VTTYRIPLRMRLLRDHRPAGRAWRAGRLLGAAVAVSALAGFTGCDLQENADLDNGEQLFTQKCGTCHALTGAGTSATVGPNLDDAFAQARSSGMDQDTIEGVVESQISNPRPATPEQVDVYMPSDLVTGDDAVDVAAYVASVAGLPGIKPPEFVAPEFFATNCGGCHTLSQAGTTGTIGPNLDQVLPGTSPMEISTDITDPDAQIAPGFPAGVMPQNYGTTLPPEDLQALVQFLTQAVGGGGGGGAAGGGGAGGGGGGGAGGQ